MGGYSIAKVWQERVVLSFAKANSWNLTIMRPGFIWGNQHAQIAGMGRHVGRTYLMFGPFTRLPLSHVVNCADCLVAAAERPAAIGESFNVIDGDNIRVWRYVREYAKRTGQRGFLLPLPYRLSLIHILLHLHIQPYSSLVLSAGCMEFIWGRVPSPVQSRVLSQVSGGL